MRGIDRSPEDSPHKGPITPIAFPCHDIIMKFPGLHPPCSLVGGRSGWWVRRKLAHLVDLWYSVDARGIVTLELHLILLITPWRVIHWPRPSPCRQLLGRGPTAWGPLRNEYPYPVSMEKSRLSINDKKQTKQVKINKNRMVMIFFLPNIASSGMRQCLGQQQVTCVKRWWRTL